MGISLRTRPIAGKLCALLLLSSTGHNNPSSYAQVNSRQFPETGYAVAGRFLEYWEQNGGLAQQGYPISREMQELSPTDGKAYTVQYFERAVFELHPENKAPYDVLLSLLGVFDYHRKYPEGAPAELPNNATDSVLFPETGKRLGGKFLGYWRTHGGLPQQGYPISNEFTEKSDLDGKEYRVQYFERAVFELHPENAGTRYEVLLSQLGTFQFRDRYTEPLPVRTVPLNRVQRNPMLSTQYLVWNEAVTSPGRNDPLPGSGEIWAMDLKTRQPFSVSNDAPGDQWVQDISGSTVVWTQNNGTSSIYEFDVKAKDLATGAEYTVASGPADQVQPAIEGNTVAWTEAQGNSQRLLTKELTGEKVTEITAIQNAPATSIQNLQISQDYLVWSEISENGFSGPIKESYIKALNRKTGVVSTVTSFVAGIKLGPPPQFSLADHRLVFSSFSGANPRTTILDLDTGEASPVKTEGYSDPGILWYATLHGDTLVWSGSADIWGVNLKEGKAAPLVAARGDQEHPAIAGDWVAWTNLGGPNDGLISVTSVSGAFATAEERRKPVTVPGGVSPRETVNYHAIDMVSAGEGWAVGESGILVRYKDGKWERVPTGVQSPWFDVDMVSGDSGWVAGTSGLLRYDGRQWSPVRDSSIPDATIFSIDMVSADEGWAVGARAILHYKGGRWQSATDLDPTSDATLLQSIDMVSPEEGWAVGSYSVIWHYSGGKWTQYNEPTNSTLTNVTMVSAEEGWAAGDTGAILHYTHGKWERVPNPDQVTISDFYMLSASEGWAVGSGGAILHYDGDKWTLMPVSTRGTHLESLDMVSPGEGWAVGRESWSGDSEGVILHYKDGKWQVFSRGTR